LVNNHAFHRREQAHRTCRGGNIPDSERQRD
jgi:hypothetical protein